MFRYSHIIERCPVFSGINPIELEKLLTDLDYRIEHYGKHEAVFNEGDSSAQLGIVLEGRIQMLHIDYSGARSLIAKYNARDTFMTSFAFSDTASLPVSVITDTPTTVMIIATRGLMHRHGKESDAYTRLIYNIMKEIANESCALYKRSEIISKRTTSEKLMAYLTHVAEEKGSRSFTIPYDRQELADYLEVDRSGLSVEIGKLRDAGVLESNKCRFKLL